MESELVDGKGFLLLVDVTPYANFENEDDRVVEVGEEHSPSANTKPVGLVGRSSQTANVAFFRFSESLDSGGDPISSRPIEARHRLERSFRPLNLSAHPASRRRRIASSWETTSPRSMSSRPSRMAARSSAVTGSSSRGAASRTARSVSAPCRRRYSRNRLAARSSGSGSSSTSVCSVARVPMVGLYTSARRWRQSALGRSWPHSGSALNQAPHQTARCAHSRWALGRSGACRLVRAESARFSP